MLDWLEHGAEPGWTSSYQPSPSHPSVSRKRRRKGGKGRRARSRPRGGSISTAGTENSDASSEASDAHSRTSDSTFSPMADIGGAAHPLSPHSPHHTTRGAYGMPGVSATAGGFAEGRTMSSLHHAKRARLDVDSVLASASLRPQAGAPVEPMGRVLPASLKRCSLFDTVEAPPDCVAPPPAAAPSRPSSGEASSTAESSAADLAAAAAAGAGDVSDVAAPPVRATRASAAPLRVRSSKAGNGRLWRRQRAGGPAPLDYGFFGLSTSPLGGDSAAEGADYDFCAVLRAGVSLADPFPSARLLMPVTSSELDWTTTNHQFLWSGAVEAM